MSASQDACSHARRILSGAKVCFLIKREPSSSALKADSSSPRAPQNERVSQTDLHVIDRDKFVHERRATTLDRSVQTGLVLGAEVSVRSLAFGSTIAVVSYLVLVPLIMLLYASVKSTEDKLPFESTGITSANYTAVLTSPATLPIFVNTLLFTVGSLAVGLPLAIFLAWLLERTAIPARALDCQFDSRADDDAVAAVGDRLDPAARSAQSVSSTSCCAACSVCRPTPGPSTFTRSPACALCRA